MMNNSKILNGLDPVFAALLREWESRIEREGGKVRLTEGIRTPQRQDRLHDQGRKTAGPIVTNARGTPVMQSSHGFGIAVDFVPVVDGIAKYDSALMKHYGRIATGIGLEWGGDWYAFPDAPHIQYLQGHSLSYFQKGGRLQPVEPNFTVTPVQRLTNLTKRLARTTDYSARRILQFVIDNLTRRLGR